MSTEAEREAIRRYQDGMSRVYLWMTPEEKDQIRAQAEAHGESVTAYLLRLAEEDGNRKDGLQ